MSVPDTTYQHTQRQYRTLHSTIIRNGSTEERTADACRQIETGGPHTWRRPCTASACVIVSAPGSA
eukprot:3717720-Rhodomonas_salina.3